MELKSLSHGLLINPVYAKFEPIAYILKMKQCTCLCMYLYYEGGDHISVQVYKSEQ